MSLLTSVLHDRLGALTYDSVHNFLRFYIYTKGKSDLDKAWYKYIPTDSDEYYTCVGLARDLKDAICSSGHGFDLLPYSMYFASSEEAVAHVEDYVRHAPDPNSVEKEHVVLSIRLSLLGRKGYIILDPGYHLSTPVVIMEDGLYPHTGPFLVDNHSGRQWRFNYFLNPSNPDYVVWSGCTLKDGEESQHFNSLLYLGADYLSRLCFTEKRNITYCQKNWVRRDRQGQTVAGVYTFTSPTNEHISIFTQANQIRTVTKIPFTAFEDLSLLKDYEADIYKCSRAMGIKVKTFVSKLKLLSIAFTDQYFMRWIRSAEEVILAVADDN